MKQQEKEKQAIIEFDGKFKKVPLDLVSGENFSFV
jgi:hypothetical protein